MHTQHLLSLLGIFGVCVGAWNNTYLNPVPSGLQRSETGDHAWDIAIQQATNLVAQMSTEELNNITYGFQAENGCSGTSGSVLRLAYPGMCLQDGPTGSKGELVSAFAAGVSVAASFNRELAYLRGYYMGAEFKRKGVQAINGPVVGPIGRVATGGRAWEGFGADPFLSGQLVAPTIAALQKSVIAVVKHYILNEQETFRYAASGLAVSEDADDTTLHELYLPPFQDAVRAGSAAVMCAYNRINSTSACENDRTLNQILKDELNFPGFVVSDWIFGQTSGLPSAIGGLDMAMPSSPGRWENGTLAAAVTSGQLRLDRLQDMGKRILASWLLHNTPSNSSAAPGFGLPVNLLTPHELIDARDPASDASTKLSAIEGHVLVKNINNALPLSRPKLMSIFGWDAHIPLLNTPSAGAISKQSFGLQSVNITEAEALQALIGEPPELPVDIAGLGTMIVGGGSGANIAPYWTDPFSAITRQAKRDRTFLYWDLESSTPTVSQASEACLVFINQFSSETIDRKELHDERSDELVQHVADRCQNTIVVIHNAWIRLVDAWIEHPNVTAVLFAHLPGQDSGEALVDILYGEVSPSGRLPYTIGRNESDYGSLLLPASPSNDTRSIYTERTNIDYKHFLSNDIRPRFPFGYGLTYSNFTYSNIQATWLQPDRPINPPNPNQLIPGGIKSLFDTLARVTVQVTNTGSEVAAEVAQLYMRFPSEQKTMSLRGFDKQTIHPGSSTVITFTLSRRDLSRWNQNEQLWQLQDGKYEFFAGPNVLDAPSTSSITLCRSSC